MESVRQCCHQMNHASIAIYGHQSACVYHAEAWSLPKRPSVIPDPSHTTLTFIHTWIWHTIRVTEEPDWTGFGFFFQLHRAVADLEQEGQCSGSRTAQWNSPRTQQGSHTGKTQSCVTQDGDQRHEEMPLSNKSHRLEEIVQQAQGRKGKHFQLAVPWYAEVLRFKTGIFFNCSIF